MQNQRVVTAQMNSAVVFDTQIVQSFFFLNPKFQACSHLLRLHSPICGQKPRRPVFSFSGSYIIYMISPICIIRMKGRLAGQLLDILYRSTYTFLAADFITCLPEKGAKYCT